MKSFILSTKFLFMTLTTLPLAMCSSDDDGEAEISFEPVTLNFSGITVQEDDSSFTVKGFSFNNVGAKSHYYSTLGSNDEIIQFDGISLWHDGTSLRYVELLLDSVEGMSKITAKVFNNGTIGTVILYNNGNVVEENDTPYRNSDIVFDVKGKTIDKLRITSAEGAVISIKLE